jgi:hypothetical protein
VAEKFLISNKSISNNISDLILLDTNTRFKVYIESQSCVFKSGEILILIHGYVQPRNDCFNDYKHLEKYNLIYVLYEKYKSGFVDYIKGVFLIIIINQQDIEVFTDHLGMQSCFLYQSNTLIAIAGSINDLKHHNIDLEPDIENLAIKAILHRIPSGYTPFKLIKRTQAGTHITINSDVINITQYWKADSLLTLSRKEQTFNDFAEFVKVSFNNFVYYQKPDCNAVTLTGGKDSRTGLAALKANGIDPVGFTYGNPFSRDGVFARRLAGKISIPHHVFSPPDDEAYFNGISNEILSYGNPDISLHRSHRLYAFKEMAARLNGTSAYYAGYLGGEFLMGIYYDDLVFTKFLTDFWETNRYNSSQPGLDYYFHKPGCIDKNVLDKKSSALRCFDAGHNLKERQFYGIFEIGIPHHSQDISLAGKYFSYVYPFYIDIDFLEKLFSSRFSFLYADNKSYNLISRYKLFEFNLNVQHLLHPQMDDVPFGKRGTYNTREFLRGRYQWAAVKTTRYILERHRYPATYTYGVSFRNFLLGHLLELESERGHILNEYYNVPGSIAKLRSITGETGERPMQPFSNIVMLYRFMKLHRAT